MRVSPRPPAPASGSTRAAGCRRRARTRRACRPRAPLAEARRAHDLQVARRRAAEERAARVALAGVRAALRIARADHRRGIEVAVGRRARRVGGDRDLRLLERVGRVAALRRRAPAGDRVHGARRPQAALAGVRDLGRRLGRVAGQLQQRDVVPRGGQVVGLDDDARDRDLLALAGLVGADAHVDERRGPAGGGADRGAGDRAAVPGGEHVVGRDERAGAQERRAEGDLGDRRVGARRGVVAADDGERGSGGQGQRRARRGGREQRVCAGGA